MAALATPCANLVTSWGYLWLPLDDPPPFKFSQFAIPGFSEVPCFSHSFDISFLCKMLLLII